MDESTRFALAVSEAAEHQRRARELVSEAGRRLDMAQMMAAARRGHRFSIVRAVQAMTADGGGGLVDGLEAEVAQETARQAGRVHDRNRVLLPFGVLMGQRTLIAGTGAAGGYIADNLDVTIGEALRGFSVAFDAGVSSLSGLKSNVQIAQESTSGDGYWIGETGTATTGNVTFGAAPLAPKHAGGYLEISGQLLKQAPGVDVFLGRSLRRTLGKLLDTAVISGTGTDEPLGIVNTDGVTVGTGTGLDYGDLLAEQEAVAAAYAAEANHVFIGSPDVRTLLSERARGTGGDRFLWDDDRVLGRRAFATPACGTQTIVHGDFSQVVLGLFGPDAFELQVNPYAGFSSNKVGVRVLLTCDLALLNPTAVRVLSAIN